MRLEKMFGGVVTNPDPGPGRFRRSEVRESRSSARSVVRQDHVRRNTRQARPIARESTAALYWQEESTAIPTHGRHTGQNTVLQHSPPGPVILTQGPDPGRSTPKTATCKARPTLHATQQAPTTPNSIPDSTQAPELGANLALHPQEVPLLSPLTRLGPQGHIGHSIMRGNARGARKARTHAEGRARRISAWPNHPPL